MAKKFHFGARKNISNKKQWHKIFSDKFFSVEIFSKLFNNVDHPQKWVPLLKNINI